MLTSKSILVIEDDHDIRVCYREALEFQRFTIHSATNGNDGLFLLSKLKRLPDLIILDLGMPLMGGEEFLENMLKDSNLKDIPVLIVSNMTPKLNVEWRIPVLKKPIDLDDFILKVNECLGGIPAAT